VDINASRASGRVVLALGSVAPIGA
jgi:hypothetical protein